MRRMTAVLIVAMAAWGCAGAQTATTNGPPLPPPVEPPPIERGQNPPRGAYSPGFDVQHYDIAIDLRGAVANPPTIEGTTTIDVRLVAPRRDSLRLDFTGLRVLRVQAARGAGAFADAGYRYANGHLDIAVPAGSGDALRVQVVYDGTPDDGLIISDNVHGVRSAFVDNWPNRTRFWFPAVDYPGDKATVSYAVRAPADWQVVTNGPRTDGLAETAPPADGVWRFRVGVPIPTYTMVIGATDFAVSVIDACADGRRAAVRPTPCVPITSWVFPPDTAAGERNFGRSDRMVEIFSELIAPFPYEKLAHVQSATEFGGMENVGAIFYSEQGLAQNMNIEGTVAHEVAHQWFGDAVTQTDWQHIWLSEGFATYFEAIFYEREDGVHMLREKMMANAAVYLGSEVTDLPVVDTTASLLPHLFALLNTNSYQKGAWVLHMMRAQIGDNPFFEALRNYYNANTHGNALTADLQAEFERSSGEDLDWFFSQWVYRPGHPILRASHEYDDARDVVKITIEQVQKESWPVFFTPLAVDIVTAAGTVRETIELTDRVTVVELPLASAPTALRLDPDGWLLHTVAP